MGSTCPANWTTYPLPFFLSKSRFDSVSLVYDEALHMLWAILRFGTSANQTLFLVSLSVYGGLLAPPMAINASYVGNTKSCNLSTSTCQGWPAFRSSAQRRAAGGDVPVTRTRDSDS